MYMSKDISNANKSLSINDDLNIEKNRNLIFVYCPPKVGSTSLVSSIRLYAANKFTVIHVHNEMMISILCGIKNITINEIIQYNKSLGKNVYVIDIYRSPIEQKISLYFEEIASIHFNTTEQHINKMNPQCLINRFNNIFPHIETGDHFKNVYNIGYDYAAEPFDFNKKYILKEINGIKYIKLRLKDSATDWSRILKELLNIDIVIVKDYETEQKIIKESYVIFKNDYLIPSNFYEIIKNIDTLKYYYSEEEINEYMSNWFNKQTSIHQSYNDQEYALYRTISNENIGYNVLQTNHYMDTGCICRACTYKRTNIIRKLNNGEQNTEKIIHEVVKAEYLQNVKIPQFNRKIQKINRVLVQLKNKVPKRKISKNLTNNF